MATLAKYCSILYILNLFGSFGQNVEIDTSANVKYIYKQVSLPNGEIRTLKLTEETNQSDIVVLLNCSDGSLVKKDILNIPVYSIPVHCEKFYNENVNKINEDSLKSIFNKCVEDYYLQISNYVKIDTLYVLDEIPAFNLNLTDEKKYFVSKQEIYNADTSEYRILEFYSINELKGECISGEYFRIKSVKHWSDGKKNGDWKYFDKSGQLIQLIEYKSDIIIRREDY
jgi:antitoxin component YwqK of YwqJK toxin-antitoxin module